MTRSFILALTAVFVLGCGGSDGTTPSAPEAGEGEINFTIERSAKSTVPASADSAVVRLWHPTAGTNQIKRVEIPDPDSTTDVEFAVPARTGYSVGVAAFTQTGSNASTALHLAGDRADGVDVSAGETTVVDLTPEAWRVEMTAAPDTLVSGEESTFEFDIVQGPVEGFLSNGTHLRLETEPWESSSGSNFFDGGLGAITFTAPTVDTDTTTWLQFRFILNGSDWDGAGGNAGSIFVPSLELGDTLLTRPIVAGSGGVTVTFDRQPSP